jgi:hypothetical protein
VLSEMGMSTCEPHLVIIADRPHIPGMDGGAGLGEAPSSELHPPVAVAYWSSARRGELQDAAPVIRPPPRHRRAPPAGPSPQLRVVGGAEEQAGVELDSSAASLPDRRVRKRRARGRGSEDPGGAGGPRWSSPRRPAPAPPSHPTPAQIFARGRSPPVGRVLDSRGSSFGSMSHGAPWMSSGGVTSMATIHASTAMDASREQGRR